MAKSDLNVLDEFFVPGPTAVDPNQQLLDSMFVPSENTKISPDIISRNIDKVFNTAENAELDSLRFMDEMFTADINVADPVDITLGEVEEPNPIGFVDAMKQARGKELLPFIGPLFKIKRIANVMAAANRLSVKPTMPENNSLLTEQENLDRQLKWTTDRLLIEKWVQEFDERQARGISVPGRIAEGLTQLPGFVIEFILTGPVFRASSKATQLAATRIIGRMGAKAVGIAVGTLARTTVNIPRITEGILLRLIPNVQLTDKGQVLITESKEKPLGAFIKSFGDLYIENLSEIAGGAVPVLFKKVPFLGKFTKALKAEWLVDNPGGDFLGTMLKKGGFNGFIGEMGEERLGDVLRAATGLQDFGGESFLENLQNAAIPNMETLLTEAGVIAPLAAIGAAGRVIAPKKPAKAITPAEPTITPEKPVGVPAAEEGVISKKRKEIEATRISPIKRGEADTPAQIAQEMQRISELPQKQQKAIQEQAVKDVKSRISKKPIRRIPGQFARDILLKTDKAFRDEFAVLRKAMKAADIEGLRPEDNPVDLAVAFTQKSSSKARNWVIDQASNLAGHRVGKSLKASVEPVVDRLDDFTAYMVAARDLNSPEKESGINPVASRLTFDSLDSPEFAAAARDVTAWNHAGIDLLVESGAISFESGQKIKDSNPIYLPFFREFAPGEQVAPPSRGAGVAKAGEPIKKREGSKRKILEPFTSMIQQMERVITTAQRATVARATANLVEQNPEGLSEFMTAIKPPVRPTFLTPKEIRSDLEELGVDFSGVEDVDMDTFLTVFRPTKQDKPFEGIFKLRVDGKDKWFKIEKELSDVLMGMDTYRMPWYLDIMFGKPTRAVKLGATGLNATFGLVRNPLRDIGTFTVTSEFAKGGAFSAIGGIGKDVVTKFSGVAENFGVTGIPKSTDVQLFSALGGEMSGFIGRDRRGVKHLQHEMVASNGVRYIINTFRHPVDLMRTLVGITESGVRIGEFGPALKQGEKLYGKGSLSASVFALNAAQDVTVNFTRHGTIGKQLNEIIPFFNVAIQAPDKIIRSFRDRPFKSTASAIATMTVPAVGLWWLNKDKPWYRNMATYEKANYLHFENPNDPEMIIRIPVPYELGHIFQALPVAILAQKYRDNPGEVQQIFEEVLKQANPLDYPAAIGPIVDIMRNEDFAGRPIIPRGAEGKLPEDQFGPFTDEIFKVIAKEFNAHAPESLQLSPANMEHAINSYSGGLYNRVSRMITTNDMEKVPSDIPVIGTLFIRDPFAPRRQIERFYDEREKLNRKFESKKITLSEVVERIQVNAIAPLLNVTFNKIRETKTVDEQKLLWGQIEQLIEFDFVLE